MTKGKGRIIKWNGDKPLIPIPNLNYASLMLQQFTKYADSIALVDGKTGESYTYKDLLRFIPSVSDGLAANGVSHGDAVILITNNHIDTPITILGILRLGAICVPINPLSTIDELKHIISVSGAKWAVASEKAAGRIEEAFVAISTEALKKLWIIGESSTSRQSVKNLMMSSFPESTKLNSTFDAATTVALMPFSSGTTGLPKGVMLSHRNLVTTPVQRMFQASLAPEPPFNILASTIIVLPTYHMLGFNMVMSTLIKGGQCVILTRFAPKEFFQAVERYKATYVPLVPYIMKLFENSSMAENYDLSSIKLFVFGSEPVTTKTLDAMSEKFGVLTLQGYGLTESSGIGSTNSPTGPTDANCVGQFQPFFQAKVIDTVTGELLGEGEEGEICIRGPSVMLGYANNPKATANTIDTEGWLHTGDLGYFDEDNYFFISGRMKELIKVKGYQVAPVELENVIKEFPGVADVAVVGVPHDRLGEAPRAFVTKAADSILDTKELSKHVASRVAPYKQLAGGIEIVKSIPKNHIGKAMRRQLRKSYEEALRSKL